MKAKDTGIPAHIDQTAYFLFKAENPVGTILYTPALGVNAQFYTPLAASFAGSGYNVLVHELRGIGISPVRAGRNADFGYSDIINTDFPRLMALAQSMNNAGKVIIAGHSLGGHLSALYLARHRPVADAFVLTACSTPYYRFYNGATRYILRYGTYLIQAIALAMGYFPGSRLGFGGREAKTLISDWSRLARTNLFRLKGDLFDYEAALRSLDPPVLSLCFATDPMAPPRAVKGLNAKFPGHLLTERVLSGEQSGAVDHFSWVNRYGGVTGDILEWIETLDCETPG